MASFSFQSQRDVTTRVSQFGLVTLVRVSFLEPVSVRALATPRWSLRMRTLEHCLLRRQGHAEIFTHDKTEGIKIMVVKVCRRCSMK